MADFLSSVKETFLREHTSEFLQEHLRAGEAFNRLVSQARMRSYFAKAISEQFPTEDCRAVAAWRTHDDADHQFDYIAPGNLPQGTADGLLYWLVFWALKEHDSKAELLDRTPSLRRFVLPKRQKELLFDEVAADRENRVEEDLRVEQQ